MKISILLIAAIFSFSNAAFAQLPGHSAEDEKVMMTYIQYISAKASARLCNAEHFENAEQKEKFDQNYIFVKTFTAGVLMKAKPHFTSEQIDANLKFMEDGVNADLKKKHTEEGCENEVIRDALKWNENFKKMRPMFGVKQ